MKPLKIIISGSLLALMVACSSPVIKASHSKSIDAVDSLIVESMNEYISECYEPIKAKDIPESGCQTSLFSVMERRHGMSFNEVQLSRVAEELFFNQYIADRLSSLVRRDPKVRRAVKHNFRSKKDMIGHYRKVYSFNER